MKDFTLDRPGFGLIFEVLGTPKAKMLKIKFYKLQEKGVDNKVLDTLYSLIYSREESNLIIAEQIIKNYEQNN